MKSAVFRLGRGRCCLLLMMEQAPAVGWILLAVCIALLVAGFLFSPWAGVAALGVVAFLTVSVFNLVMMACGLNSVTGLNMAPHSLGVEDETVVAEFEDGGRVEVDLADLRPYRIYPGGVVVPVEGSRKGWLWVPPAAFGSPEDFQAFMAGLYKRYNPICE